MTEPETSVDSRETGPWDEARRARAVLAWLAEPGHRGLGRMVRALGPAETMRRVLADAVPDAVRSAIAARREALEPDRLADQLEAEARRLGCRLATPEDPDWPRQVEDLGRLPGGGDPRADPRTDPPCCLWVRGGRPLAETLERAVALVGARAASEYGRFVATDLAHGMCELGWTVVSGGAYGIDAAAHQGALAAGGPTVAVLANGIDVAYPVAHSGLFDRVSQDGLLVSEWPPGATAQRHRFLIRNRVIAAMCRGTVVVEASARSGARNTARRTIQLGRSLMAVPGPVTSAMSVGTHLLVREDQARLVTSAAEILEEVGRIGEDLAPVPRGATDPRDTLDPVATRVLDAVPMRRGASVERIAVVAGVPAVQVRRCLPMLGLLGFVEETDAGYRLAPGSSPRQSG